MPTLGVGIGWLVAGAAAAAGTVTALSLNETKAAKKAANAQRDIANAQIQAEKDKETMAQETATNKLKAARAKKSNTILTSPLGVDEDANVNTPGTIGV